MLHKWHQRCLWADMSGFEQHPSWHDMDDHLSLFVKLVVFGYPTHLWRQVKRNKSNRRNCRAPTARNPHPLRRRGLGGALRCRPGVLVSNGMTRNDLYSCFPFSFSFSFSFPSLPFRSFPFHSSSIIFILFRSLFPPSPSLLPFHRPLRPLGKLPVSSRARAPRTLKGVQSVPRQPPGEANSAMERIREQEVATFADRQKDANGGVC